MVINSKTLVTFTLLLFCLLLVSPGNAIPLDPKLFKTTEFGKIWNVPGEELLLGEFFLDRSIQKDDENRIHLCINSDKEKKMLYTVKDDGQTGQIEQVKQRILFRVPSRYLTQLQKNYLFIQREHIEWGNLGVPSTVEVKLMETPVPAKILTDWQRGFRKQLDENIRLFEDNEPELVLYLRWFGHLPSSHKTNWKSDRLFRFLTSISGLADIRSAIPMDRRNSPKLELPTQEPPQPIRLPEVASKKTDLAADLSCLAGYVPRSCWYFETKTAADCQQILSTVATNFTQWSPTVYPLGGKELIDHHFARLGLTAEALHRLDSLGCQNFTLAGWDFNFQSGLSLLVVLRTTEKVKIPTTTPFSWQVDDHTIMLSTSRKLLAMAQMAEATGRSLRQVDNFRMVRNKLLMTNNELCYLYFSDHWLTNFISPRWQILADRLNALDARIRLISLLKLIHQEESGENLPLEVLAQKKLLKGSWNEWLFRDLEEIKVKNTTDEIRIQDPEMGGLFAHQSIDMLPFSKVTKTEFDSYESFKRTYSRRWQQMDPIAFQVFKPNADGVWKTKLYVSPISNQSGWRFIRNMVPAVKVLHKLEKIPHRTFGLSLALSHKLFSNFSIPGINLPVTFFVQAFSWDFAPTSYSPRYWLKSMRRQDEISWMRMPAAVSIPALVLSGGLPIAVRAIQSEFKKLRKIADMSWNPWYPVYTLDRPDSGMLAVAVDPQTLLRMDGLSEKTSEISAVSCDLWWFLDLKEGYQLRRKLFHELVKNRSIDEWRMERRFERLQGYFGIPQSIRSGSPFRTKLEQSNAFVMPAKKWETFVNAMPLNAELDSHRYASTTARSFDLLPDFFLRLEKIESFVCLEENAINMEMNWKIPLSSYRVEEVTPKETIESQNVPVDNAPLDFDLE